MKNNSKSEILTIPSIEYDIVDQCNLNCKGCGHLSPINNDYFADEKSFEKDLLRIKELGINVEKFRLLGGEPLLHPKINEFIIITRKVFENSFIEVVTNGILLFGMQESFWKLCKTLKINIYVSKYPINIDYQKIADLSLVKDVNIGFSNTTYFFHKVLSSSKIYDSEENFNLCQSKNKCVYLRDGKLYVCAGGYLLNSVNHHFNTNIPLSEYDYLNIYTYKLEQTDIISFLNTHKQYCGWCHLPHEKGNIKWDLSKKTRDEWID